MMARCGPRMQRDAGATKREHGTGALCVSMLPGGPLVGSLCLLGGSETFPLGGGEEGGPLEPPLTMELL